MPEVMSQSRMLPSKFTRPEMESEKSKLIRKQKEIITRHSLSILTNKASGHRKTKSTERF